MNNQRSIKQWFYRFGTPQGYYQQSKPWAIGFGLAAFALLTLGVVWGLAFAPPDYQQGDSFRIIYIHVPAAMLAQNLYLMIGAASALFLIWRVKMADVFATSAVPLGLVICALALLTGAIWGRPTWGAWWVWDARTTSTLLLFFLYLGLWALRGALLRSQAASMACAILALVGLVNIPIIKYSVDWWFTLHQGATFTLTSAPTMPPTMYAPLIATSLGAICLMASSLLLMMRAEVLLRDRGSSWVKTMLTGGIDR